MEKETKDKLKEVINELEENDNVFLITNNVCCIIGSLHVILENLITASLKNDNVDKLMQLLINLERGKEK